MSNSQYSYVLFDAGGTLLGTNTDSEFWYEQFFVDACAEQGCVVNVHQVHEVLRRAARSRQFDTRCSSDAESRTFWQHIYSTAFADLLGAKGMNRTPGFIEHLAADYIDRFEQGEFVRLFPDALQTLDTLAGHNVKMGIVSNFSTYLDDFLKQLDIAKYFDFVITSAAVGCEKPGNEIFRKALTKCNGCEADKIVFVGDHPEEDYVPATQCGMSAILIDRHNRHTNYPQMVRINRLQDVCGFIGAA